MLNPLQKKDLSIISQLRINARETLTNMSKKTKVPISTIYDRLKQQEGNIIKKHTSLINWNILGFNAWAIIALRTTKEDRQKLREYLTKHQNINSVFKINNGFDFMIEGIFRNIKEIEEFIEHLEEKFKIKTKQVYYIIDDIKRESFMSDSEMIDILFPEIQDRKRKKQNYPIITS